MTDLFLKFCFYFYPLYCVSDGSLHTFTGNAFTVLVYETERIWSLVRLEKLQEKLCPWKLFPEVTGLDKLSWIYISDGDILIQQYHVSKIDICMVVQHIELIKQKVSEIREASRFWTINAVMQSSGRKWQLLLIIEFLRTLCLALFLPTLSA